MTKKKKKFEWGWLLLIPGLGFIIYFVVASFSVMAAQSVGLFDYSAPPAFTLTHWQTVFDKVFFDSLWFSVKTGVLSSVFSLAICYPLALALQKSAGRKALLAIIKTPLFVPGLVCSFLIINIIDYHGVVNELLLFLKVIKEPLRMRNDNFGAGVIAIQIWKNVPFQLIIMFSALESIRKDVKDAARNLGANGWNLFALIILPLTIPSALVAVILVFIRTFNDFAIVSTAGPLYPTSLAVLMQREAYIFQQWGISACVGVMMMLATVLFVSIYTYIGNKLERME